MESCCPEVDKVKFFNQRTVGAYCIYADLWVLTFQVGKAKTNKQTSNIAFCIGLKIVYQYIGRDIFSIILRVTL